MKQDNFPLARQNEIVVQESTDEVLVYDLKTDKVFCLNETSAAIWQLCDGKNDIAAIASQFQTQSNQQIPVELVELAVENLGKENLLENYQPQDLMNKTSRREMIRKIGLTTAVALPVIASIVAPVSAAATSCASGLTFCNARTPFGFNLPAGCFDLQNGAVVPSTTVEECTFCGNFCIPGFTCTAGMCS